MRRRGLAGAALLLALLGFAPVPAEPAFPGARADTGAARPAALAAVLTQLDDARAAGIARAYVPVRVLWTDEARPLSGRARRWLRGMVDDPLQAARLTLRGWLLLAYATALFAGWYYLLLLLLHAGQFRRDGASLPARLALPFFAVPLLWRYATPAEQRLSRAMLGLVPVWLLLLGALPTMLAARAPEIIAFTAAGRGSLLEFWLSSWSLTALVPGQSSFALWNYGWPLLLGWCGLNALGVWLVNGSVFAAAAGPAADPAGGADRALLRVDLVARLMPGFAAAFTGNLAAGARLAGLLALVAALALLPAPWWENLLAGGTGRRTLLAAALTGYAIIALAVACRRAPARLRSARRKTDAAAAGADGPPER